MQNNLTQKDIENLNKWAEKYNIDELKINDKEKIFNLKYLYIGSENLKRLPKEIGGLINLEELDIDCDNLESLSEEIQKLSNLKSLHIRSDNLKRLPKEIGYLINLEKLTIKCYDLERLPDGIQKLSNLKSLVIKRLSKEIVDLIKQKIFKIK